MNRKQATQEQKEAAAEKRAFLKELTKMVKPLVQAGEYNTYNDAIISTIYTDDENQEFKTFWDWKKAGKKVIKGEQGFIIWGRPIGKTEMSNDQQEEKTINFFPVCYIFSNNQVEDIK